MGAGIAATESLFPRLRLFDHRSGRGRRQAGMRSGHAKIALNARMGPGFEIEQVPEWILFR